MNEKHYQKMFLAVQNGQITEDEWREYCTKVLAEIMDKPEIIAVMVRLKERG